MNETFTILVIDDDPHDRTMYRTWLEEATMPLKIVGADNKKTSFKAFFEHKPDCIILDFLMLEGDGFQFLQEMKKLLPGFLPVIFVTGYHARELAEDALALGAYKYLNKNELNNEILINAIKDIILLWQYKNGTLHTPLHHHGT